MAAAEDKVTPTDGEIRILLAIFAHMNGKPDVDWDAAAATASLRSAKSLKERYRQIEGEELEEEEDDEVQQKQKPAVAAAGLDGEY
ncbi:hypothetical protein BM221_007081 [Beauveria bassiana]|uniref:Uncharacterized protein n=1 Tax=Beauveria bassiana TaxID=176275 RepID=A0A2N6NJJ1_BEABA|nr:hypothetical protein BM221_007081 [Beauveria bassiana]